MPIGKTIRRIMPKPRRHWVGNGFHVYPVFADWAFTETISPFLMLDYAPPEEFSPSSERRGVGKHPHRGFETVTIALEGEIEHKDSTGNRDIIKKGDVQWMTAGRGIIHEEFHSTRFTKQGGVLEMIQLWVNLPAEHKMTAPRYQALFKKDIPVVPINAAKDGTLRVIAGGFNGTQGPAATFTPINVWEAEITNPDIWIDISVPEGHNSLVFVKRGEVSVQEHKKKMVEGQIALLDQNGTLVRILAASPGTQIVFLTGAPIDEPIAAQGPFVMNTQAELVQANRDYHSGKLGK